MSGLAKSRKGPPVDFGTVLGYFYIIALQIYVKVRFFENADSGTKA